MQNPNVVYDLQSDLDKAGIYVREEVDAYTAVRFKSAAAYAAGEKAQHKDLYAATSAPTQRFNDKVKAERAAIQAAEAAFEVAKAQGNEVGMKQADATRAEHAEALKKLLDFKSGLTRFGSLYTYIAQTIDLGDPELEGFASSPSCYQSGWMVCRRSRSMFRHLFLLASISRRRICRASMSNPMRKPLCSNPLGRAEAGRRRCRST